MGKTVTTFRERAEIDFSTAPSFERGGSRVYVSDVRLPQGAVVESVTLSVTEALVYDGNAAAFILSAFAAGGDVNEGPATLPGDAQAGDDSTADEAVYVVGSRVLGVQLDPADGDPAPVATAGRVVLRVEGTGR